MKGYHFLTYIGIVLLSNVDIYLGSDTSHRETVNVTYDVRRALNLTCHVPVNGNITVVWRKKGTLTPISLGGSLLVESDRYEIYNEMGKTVLRVNKPDTSDAGIYECSYTVDRINTNTTLFIVTREGKQFTAIVTKQQVVKARVGHDIDLPCIVQRRHRKKVVWLDSQRHVITYGTKSLKTRFKVTSRHNRRQWTLAIKRVRNSDFGLYTCLVNTDPVLSHTILLQKEYVKTSTTSTTATTITTIVTTDDPAELTNGTTETSTFTTYLSAQIPKVGATYERYRGPDVSQDHLILGASLCGFMLCVIFVAGCYLFHRMQKMTRRIVQQEIQMENTRMRRRDRRLTSETQVYIGKASDDSKPNKKESFSETQLDGDMSTLQKKKGKRPNPYCEPWSSNSDIVAAMNVAYNQRQGSIKTQAENDHLCPDVNVSDEQENRLSAEVKVNSSVPHEDATVDGTCMDMSRGEGEGESESTEMKE